MTVLELHHSLPSRSTYDLEQLATMMVNNYPGVKPEAQGDLRERMNVVACELFARSINPPNLKDGEYASKVYHALKDEILALPALSQEAVNADNSFGIRV